MEDVYISALNAGISRLLMTRINKKASCGSSNCSWKTQYDAITNEDMRKERWYYYGYVGKNDYNSFKQIIDEELSAKNITHIKTRNWPTEYINKKTGDNFDKDKVNFVSRNLKAISALMSQYLKEYQGLEKKPNKSSSSKQWTQFENEPKVYPQFINKLSGETGYILEYLHRVNISFLFSHLKLHPDTESNFEELAQKYGDKGPKPSLQNAQVSTIYSFLDYTEAYVDILKQLTQVHNKSATQVGDAQWKKWRNYKSMVKALPPDLKYVSYRPTDIYNKADKDIHGFLHTACHTGVLFPQKFNGKDNTRFHYQSRYKTPRNSSYEDYPSPDAYRHQYDDTYYLPQNEELIFEPLNLIKVKNPTSYLIRGDGTGCKACNCLLDKNLTADKLRQFLKEGIELNFTSGFNWKESGSSRYAVKTFKIASDAQREDSSLYGPIKRDFKNGGAQENIYINGNSEDYCLFSPIVPQSHEVGSGNADPQDDNTSMAKQLVAINACPFVDALMGVEADRELGVVSIDELPSVVEFGGDEFNEIKEACLDAMNIFPMTEKDCKEKTNPNIPASAYNACTNLPDTVAAGFKSKCETNATQTLLGPKVPLPVNYQGDDGNLSGNYEAYLCDAITKIYDDNGTIIWTKTKEQLENDPKFKKK
jgi:hypothetical protein